MSKHLSLCFIAGLSIIAMQAGAAMADSFEAMGLRPGVIMVRTPDLEQFKALRDHIKEEGARGLICYPPSMIFGRFPSGFGDGDLAGIDATFIPDDKGLASSSLDKVSKALARSLLAGKPDIGSYVPGEDLGEIDLPVRMPPEDLVRRSGGTMPNLVGKPSSTSAERSITQNSEFMIGSILVNVIIPESTGNTENWTDDEIATMLQDMGAGISVLQQYAHWVDMDFTINADNRQRRLPVELEPIDGYWDYDPIWIESCLSYLYQQDYFDGYQGDDAALDTHRFNNQMRERFGTDWVYTAYVVDASSQQCWGSCRDSDPNTPCYVAYTIFLGGPYIVIPYPGCRFGTGVGFSHIFLHESSHVFWALDEYASAGVPCTESSGYLDIENQNSYATPMGQSQPCGDGYWCIMNNAEAVDGKIEICEYTLGQIGLGDENVNSIPDIYEIPPMIEIIEKPGVTSDTTYDGSYLISANARNNAVPNRNPHQWILTDYAPWIKKGTMQINNGLEEDIMPSDGKWDESVEGLGMILDEGLQPGINRIRLKVENNVGMKASDDIEVVFVGIKFYQSGLTVDEGGITVSWKTADEIFGADFILYRQDLTDGTAPVAIDSIPGDGYAESGGGRNIYRYEDTDLKMGHSYRYRVKGYFSMDVHGDMKTFSYDSNDMEDTAMIPVGSELISRIVPNPSSESVTFTINVPKSYTSISSGAAGDRGFVSGTAAVEIRTMLEAAVYNVKGQIVKRLINMPMYGDYFTDTWDGTDRRGNRVAAGVYFLRVRAGDRESVRKVIMLR